MVKVRGTRLVKYTYIPSIVVAKEEGGLKRGSFPVSRCAFSYCPKYKNIPTGSHKGSALPRFFKVGKRSSRLENSLSHS